MKRVTDIEKLRMKDLRLQGISLRSISQEMGRSVSTCWKYTKTEKKPEHVTFWVRLNEWIRKIFVWL